MNNQNTLKQEFKNIPISGNLYSINKEGSIKDMNGDLLPTFQDDNNNLVVKIFWIEGLKNYNVSLLIAFTFLPVYIPVKFWSLLEIISKDGNKSNIEIKNLVWKFPRQGIECVKNPGYYYIPNFTKYCINHNGRVIQHFTGNVLFGITKETGYHYYAISKDVKSIDTGRFTTLVGRHRLLAFTFLDCPDNFEDLDVNHKNGIPGDDRLDNLEFLSRSGNILHAYANGLRNDNKPVLVTNHNTGEIVKYFSANEAERKLGLKRGTLYYRLSKGKNKIYPPGLSFCFENDIKTIKEKPVPVLLINTKTGEQKHFDSLSQCSSYLNISKKVIQKRLKNENKAQFNEYIFEKVL